MLRKLLSLRSFGYPSHPITLSKRLLNLNNLNAEFQKKFLCSKPWYENLYQTGDAVKDRELRLLQTKIQLSFEEGNDVPNPEYMKPEHWENLLKMKAENAQEKYLQFINVKIKYKLKKQAKSKIKAEFSVVIKENRIKQKAENTHLYYGLAGNTIFMKIYRKTISKMSNRTLLRRERFAPKIVFDCSYDDVMSIRERRNTGKQLNLSFAANRRHKEPFNLHYCNAHSDAPCIQAMHNFSPTMYEKTYPIHLHKECMTEVFPKDKLVYLTPHSNAILQEYDPNDIYVVGAFVDRAPTEAISLSKAKQLGIRTARLPIEQYIRWGTGSKYLTLNQVVSILLDVQQFRDWNRAFLNLPRRKLY